MTSSSWPMTRSDGFWPVTTLSIALTWPDLTCVSDSRERSVAAGMFPSERAPTVWFSPPDRRTPSYCSSAPAGGHISRPGPVAVSLSAGSWRCPGLYNGQKTSVFLWQIWAQVTSQFYSECRLSREMLGSEPETGITQGHYKQILKPEREDLI